MSQRLILPVNRAIITAGYKTRAYAACFGVPHFGVDLYSGENRIVYACGKGRVLLSGLDSIVGNTVAVLYEHVDLGNRTGDVVLRCFHMQDVRVKKGQQVTKDTILGHWGSTGKYVQGAHLHIEADLDTAHFQGVPGLGAARSTLYYRGGDTMINPAAILHPYDKDGQSVTYSGVLYHGRPFAEAGGFSEISSLTTPEEDKSAALKAAEEGRKRAEKALKAAEAKMAAARKLLES